MKINHFGFARLLHAGEASIARLLSVSSVKTDPSLSRLLSVSSVRSNPSLSDVTSGYCGHGGTAAKSSSIISDISSLARKERCVNDGTHFSVSVTLETSVPRVGFAVVPGVHSSCCEWTLLLRPPFYVSFGVPSLYSRPFGEELSW